MMNRCNVYLCCRLFNRTVSLNKQVRKPLLVPIRLKFMNLQPLQVHGVSNYGPIGIVPGLKKTRTSSLLPTCRTLASSERTTTEPSDDFIPKSNIKKEDSTLTFCSDDDAVLSNDVLSKTKLSVVDTSILPEDELLENSEVFEVDILEETEHPEILEHFSDMPLMPETYTLASYVDHSETLQKLVQIGVDLSKVQSRKGVANMLMKMDFDRDIKDKLAFLHHTGVPGEQLGSFITKNPFILGEELQNLEARVHYLRQKGFSEADVSQIVCRAPYFLNFSVERIDNKLGYYQQLLKYSDSKVREIITRCPKLVTMKISRPKENLFVLEFQCGFSKGALHSMVLKEPAVLLRGKFRLIATFDYLHNVMEIPHKTFLKSPQIFLGQVNKVKDRHKFLTLLQRNQYDPNEPGYVPLMSLIKLPDQAFCQDIARTSLEEYNHFLKTSRT